MTTPCTLDEALAKLWSMTCDDNGELVRMWDVDAVLRECWPTPPAAEAAPQEGAAHEPRAE